MTMSGMGQASGALMAAGLAVQAVGGFYSVKSAQYKAKSQALTLEFEQTIAYMNARSAERDAQRTLRAGQEAAGRVGLQYGQVKEGLRTRQAAGGIQAGVGSAAEVATSVEYAKESDMNTIGRNAVYGASAHRRTSASFYGRGLLAGASARNIRGMAGAMNPWISSGLSLLGGSGQVGMQYESMRQRTSNTGGRGGSGGGGGGRTYGGRTYYPPSIGSGT
jgi:hypothetical protein